MTNKITHAPQAVIDWVDNLYNSDDNLFDLQDLLNGFMDGGNEALIDWKFDNGSSYKSIFEAIVKHAMGIERLQPERETHYIVTDGGGNFYLEDGSLYVDSAENHDAKDYQGQGMTKEQAIGLVNLFGGEVVEIPEREIRYYTIKKLGGRLDSRRGAYVVNELIRHSVNGREYMFIERTSVESPEDYQPAYERGMSYKMAKAISDETGAEIEEIK